MSTPRPAFLLLLIAIFAACSPPPPPPVVAVTPGPAVVVAAPQAAEAARGAAEDDAFVDDADPGPVPVRAFDPWWGRRDAPVTIVMYGDFQCPFCSRAVATLDGLKRTYGPEKLRVVWRHWPLPFHDKARPAALLAMMVFDRFGNEAFWRLHDAFFAEQRALDAVVEREARRLGLGYEDLQAMANGPAKARLDALADEAKQAGITGTPGFRINGVYLSGAQQPEKFTAIIDEQLSKAGQLVSKGVPRHRVYAELAKAQFKIDPPKLEDPPDTTAHQVPIGKSAVRGKATALVTVVEFADFQCPFCGRVAPTLKQLASKYGDKIRFVFKHNPLPFHPRAEPAAELALEARAQKGDDAFWKIHDLLFTKQCSGNPQATNKSDCEANQGTWLDHQVKLETPDLLAYATSIGLDAKRVNAAIANKAHAAEITADQDLADDLAASGTPHFFINGRRLVGSQPLEKFTALIDEEMAKAEALVKSGVKPAKVYDVLMATAKPGGPTFEKKSVPAPTRDNPSRGPANAKVVVQWFGDFQCPFCARVRNTIAELEQAYPGQIRVVWRNRLLPFHKNAEPAAEAAMEAFREKGEAGFWAMHEMIYAAVSSGATIDRPALEQFGMQLGLDPLRFADALDQHTHAAVIDADTKVADDAKISGTPGFVINGYFVSGAQPLSRFKRVVKLALAGK